MHYKWKTWMEDAGLDSKLAQMRHQRKQKLIEIYYHQHYIAIQESLLAKMRSKLWIAKMEYEEMDLDLALIDGRFSYVNHCEFEDVKKAEKKVDKAIKKMSLDQRQRLIAELESMGKEK